MMDSKLPRFLILTLCLVTCTTFSASVGYSPIQLNPPEPPREFRGAWVASVANIDWPSDRGLPVDQQKAELEAIMNRAVQLKLNAIILQVRPACDALYDSPYEPWSEYLTGEMGKAPDPYYDPLKFAVKAAHDRGLELHAWFNPYRALHPSSKSHVAFNHISRTHPEWVLRYGRYLWLDPGNKEARDYSLRVILDVVKRYDIDGVHLDDYFYPYRIYDESRRPIEFPDHNSWRHYRGLDGTLSREDWRRQNVNRFVERLYAAIKAQKHWVKFGISPFGIWRPGHPPQIKGLDAFAELYADARKWFQKGWVDYLAPQLYWPTDAEAQSYPVLLNWWARQNDRQRHLWPGIAPSRIGPDRPASDITRQIHLSRQQVQSSGNIHWSMKHLMQNRGGISERLSQHLYSKPALVPAMPWLNHNPPAQPELSVAGGIDSGGLNFSWKPGDNARVWWWVVQTKSDGQWDLGILPGDQSSQRLGPSTLPELVAVTAVDRYGNAGASAVLQRDAREMAAGK